MLLFNVWCDYNIDTFQVIVITLLSATNGGRVGEQNTFQLTITPNDSPHGYIQFASPVYTVQEGSAETQNLQLSRRYSVVGGSGWWWGSKGGGVLLSGGGM